MFLLLNKYNLRFFNYVLKSILLLEMAEVDSVGFFSHESI